MGSKATPTVRPPVAPAVKAAEAPISGTNTKGEAIPTFTTFKDKGKDSDEYLQDLHTGVQEGAIKQSALDAEIARRKAAGASGTLPPITTTKDEGKDSDQYLIDMELGVKAGAIKPEALAAEKKRRADLAAPVILDKENKADTAAAQKELATTQSAIFGSFEARNAARKARKRPATGSLMTSGATDSTIGYGPVGNRKTLLGY